MIQPIVALLPLLKYVKLLQGILDIQASSTFLRKIHNYRKMNWKENRYLFCLDCFPGKYTNSEINSRTTNVTKWAPDRKDDGGRK